jgi:hypothetical protein
LTAIVNEFSFPPTAFAMYPGLTKGAIAALLHHATPEQENLLAEDDDRPDRHDELTEPHCGSTCRCAARQCRR